MEIAKREQLSGVKDSVLGNEVKSFQLLQVLNARETLDAVATEKEGAEVGGDELSKRGHPDQLVET